MSYFALARPVLALPAKREPRTKLERFHFAALPWRPLFIVACLVLGLVYLVLVNQTATNGFAIKDLEDKVNILSEANRKLEVTATELQSMETLTLASGTMDLEPVKNSRYLGAIGGTLGAAGTVATR